MRKSLFLVAFLFLLIPSSFVFAETINLNMTRKVGANVPTWHFRTGVPLGKKQLIDKDNVRLLRNGIEIPVQTEKMATWGPAGTELENSIKWLGLDFIDSIATDVNQQYQLEIGSQGQPPAEQLIITQDADFINIGNGRLELTFSKKQFDLFRTVKLDGQTIISSGVGNGAYIANESGRKFWARNNSLPWVTLEMTGPLSAIVRAEGWFVDPTAGNLSQPGESFLRPTGGFCRFITRIYIALNQPYVKVQHTFLFTEDSHYTRYSDIGLAMPLPAGNSNAVFGGMGTNVSQHSYLLQTSATAYTVKTIGGSQLYSGQKSPGWVQIGAMTISMTDFWKNYPKEYEYRPQDSQVIVHFWPDHGITRDTSTTNGWRLPFCHTGDILDFNIPVGFTSVLSGLESAYPESSKANALGVAKTHEMMFYFGDTGFDAYQKAYTARSHILADPKHIERTHAVDRITAEDMNMPNVEQWMTGGMKFYISHIDQIQSYGMWNWGDTHTMWGANGPSYWRLWAGTHHGYVRLPWWFYMRTGDPDLLDFGRAQALHIGDIDQCHFSNSNFSSYSVATIAYCKIVGGMCQCTGFVHWYCGNHVHFDSIIDQYLYDYYLTGNRRSWECAKEQGLAVADNITPGVIYIGGGREMAGPADVLTQYYKATWDPDIKPRMETAVARMTATPPTQQHAPFWSPWLTRYWEVTEDENTKNYLMDWAINGANGAPVDFTENPYEHDCLDVQAYAYYITGDKKYAKKCADRLFYRGAWAYRYPGNHYDGWNNAIWYDWAFAVRYGVMATEAAKAVNLKMQDLIPHWCYATAVSKFETKFYHDGTTKQVMLGTYYHYATITTQLYSPTGSLMATKTRSGKEGDVSDGVFTPKGDNYTLGPANPAGYYKIVHTSTQQFCPVNPKMDKVLLHAGDGQTDFTLARGRVFFLVPAGTTQFTITFNLYELACGGIFDPDLNMVANIVDTAGNDIKTVTITVPPQHRDKVWLIVGNDKVKITSLQGIDPWFGTTYKTFKEPYIPAGDIDDDGEVTAADLTILMSQWLSAPGQPSADISPSAGDGIVNHKDFAALAKDWQGKITKMPGGENLIGWWMFEEGQDSNVADASKYGNNGVISGDTYWKNNWGDNWNSFLHFDGDWDYISIQNEQNFDVTDCITVTAWINPDIDGYIRQHIVAKGGNSWRMPLYNNFDGTASIAFACSGLSDATEVTSNIDISGGRWYHVAGIYDGNNLRLYINGQLAASLPAHGNIATNNYQVGIGTRLDRLGMDFEGFIDDVRIYNTALDAASINQIYNADKNIYFEY